MSARARKISRPAVSSWISAVSPTMSQTMSAPVAANRRRPREGMWTGPMSADDPTIAERWDLFIGGMEIGPAYTELNDPDVQAAKFREQLAGIDAEETTFRNFDADFIEALKVGMPPAGGMGMGIDRLCMLLLNQPSIRDVIAFPMMRPE